MYSLSPTRTESTKSAHGTGHSMSTVTILAVPGVALLMMTHGVPVEKDAPFQVGNIPSPLTFKYSSSVSHLSQQNLQQPATTTILVGGGSVSFHSLMTAKSTMSAPGIGHSIRSVEILVVPGVAQEQILTIMKAGGTVERDAPFQVGNSLTTAISVFYAEWLNSAA